MSDKIIYKITAHKPKHWDDTDWNKEGMIGLVDWLREKADSIEARLKVGEQFANNFRASYHIFIDDPEMNDNEIEPKEESK